MSNCAARTEAARARRHFARLECHAAMAKNAAPKDRSSHHEPSLHQYRTSAAPSSAPPNATLRAPGTLRKLTHTPGTPADRPNNVGCRRANAAHPKPRSAPAAPVITGRHFWRQRLNTMAAVAPAAALPAVFAPSVTSAAPPPNAPANGSALSAWSAAATAATNLVAENARRAGPAGQKADQFGTNPNTR